MKRINKKYRPGYIQPIKNILQWKVYAKLGKLCSEWSKPKDAEEAKQRRTMPVPLQLIPQE